MTGGQLELPFDLAPPAEIAAPVFPHYESPRNDNERLLELQFQYRNENKPAALVQLLELAETIALKMINKETRRNRHIKGLAIWQRKEKAHDAAIYFFEQYSKKPAFCIKKNFPGYIFLRVQHELYYRRECDKIVDFVDLEEFFKLGTDDEPELGGDLKIV